jgi:hypothetical protein
MSLELVQVLDTEGELQATYRAHMPFKYYDRSTLQSSKGKICKCPLRTQKLLRRENINNIGLNINAFSIDEDLFALT